MSDSLQKDLALFNSIVEELLKEEKKNPVSSLINAEDLYDKVDFSFVVLSYGYNIKLFYNKLKFSIFIIKSLIYVCGL